MSNTDKHIKIYPSSWLYNAGVVGLIEVLNSNENNNLELLKQDGSIYLNAELLSNIKIKNKKVPKLIKYLVDYKVTDTDVEDWKKKEKKKDNKTYTYEEIYKDFEKEFGPWGYKFVKAGNSLFASKTPFQNLVQLSEWQNHEFSDIIKGLPENLKSDNPHNSACSLCLSSKSLNKEAKSNLEKRLTKLQISHLKELGASSGEFPNSFWNLEESLPICYLCSFLILHHRIPFIKLSDYSQIFINAPSFKLMYYLNKFVREAFGATDKKERRTKREILANSVIEYATKIQTTFGAWAGMNIEIVSKRGDNIEFFSLPYETIQIISNRKIATLLSEIGEFKILNIVLDGKYSRLINDAYKLMRIGLKHDSERGKHETDFLREHLALWRNQQQPLETAQKMLSLYALIEEQTKKK